jgi:hypothetical protein
LAGEEEGDVDQPLTVKIGGGTFDWATVFRVAYACEQSTPSRSLRPPV